MNRFIASVAAFLLALVGPGYAQVMTHEGKSIREWAAIFRMDERGREQGGGAFRAIGEPAVPVLVELLQPAEQGITRAAAATVLWQMRAAANAAIPALERTLKSDSDVVVRARAAQALLGIAGPDHPAAGRFLRDLSGDSDMPEWIRKEASSILDDVEVVR